MTPEIGGYGKNIKVKESDEHVGGQQGQNVKVQQRE